MARNLHPLSFRVIARNLLLLLIFILLGSAIVADPLSENSYRYIHAKDLETRIHQGKRVTVVDVRSDFAYRMEHIKDSVSLPLDRLPKEIETRPLPKDGIIVTYCSCPRHLAQMAADLLKKAGYSNVNVLYEGLPGWKEAAYPLEGSLANQPVRIFWVVGYVMDTQHKPRKGISVHIFQPATQQLEIAATDKEGFYSIPLRFYGLKPGDQMEVAFITSRTGGDVVFFQVGPHQTPWGTRVDDSAAHVMPRPEQFLETFKKKKLRG